MPQDKVEVPEWQKAAIEADCLFRASKEMSKWTKRSDDAKRIPDVLHEMAHELAEKAKQR